MLKWSLWRSTDQRKTSLHDTNNSVKNKKVHFAWCVIDAIKMQVLGTLSLYARQKILKILCVLVVCEPNDYGKIPYGNCDIDVEKKAAAMWHESWLKIEKKNEIKWIHAIVLDYTI